MRLWFSVHSWIGVTAGLLLFVISWSGTMAVFSREIDWALNPAIRAEGSVRSWGAIHAAVQEAYPDAVVIALVAPYQPGFAAEALVDSPTQNVLRVYVHPQTAHVQGATSFFNVQRFFRSFHMELFWGIERWGYYIVAAFSLVLLASMTTALIFYKRWWRGFFKLTAERGARVLWSDVHKLIGVWSLAFILVMGLTGAWYLVERIDSQASIFPQPQPRPILSDARLAETRGENPLSLDTLVRHGQRARPDLDIRGIYPPPKPNDLIVFDGQAGDLLVRNDANQVGLDPFDGRVVFDQGAHELSPYFRWVDTADTLHFGTFGGLATRLMWLVFGLGLSGMSLTGAYLQVQKQKQRGRRNPRIPVMVAFGVWLGVIAVSVRGAIREIESYGPLDGPERFPETSILVWDVIGAWIFSVALILFLWARWVR